MVIAGIIRLALNRFRSRLGLALLSLIGIALAVALVTSIPMFTQSVSFVVLRSELRTLGELAGRPPFAVRFYFVPSASQTLSTDNVMRVQGIISNSLTTRLALPVRQSITSIETLPFTMLPAATNQAFSSTNERELMQVTLNTMTDIEQQIVVDEGAPFGDAARDERTGVWVSVGLAERMGLQVGEQYDLHEQRNAEVIPVYIAGFWRARDSTDSYWFQNPDTDMTQALLITLPTMQAVAEPRVPGKTGFDSWYYILDESALGISRAGALADGLEKIRNELGGILPGLTMDYSPLQPIERYVQRRAVLSALLVGFSLPATALLFYFLVLVSTTTVRFQQEETAILASRGAGGAYIAALAATETVLLIAGGVPLGIVLGYGLAYAMGFTLSFLDFVSRPPLPVSLTGIDGRLLAAAVALLLAARLAPAWQAARTSIVGALRLRSRQTTSSIASRLALDVPLVIMSLYAYQRLRVRGSLGITGWEASGDPFRDPLLLLAPTLFILTACLVVAHLFPILLRPLDRLAGHWRGFAGYMGLRQLVRQSEQYTPALFLVLVCLSLGAFYSCLALSLDAWLTDRVYYQVGADYTFRQGVALAPEGGPGEGARAAAETSSWLLPVSDYLEIPGVLAATRVGDYRAVAEQPRQNKGRFIGIDRLDFAQAAYYRTDFSSVPLGEMMNRLAMYEDGILVSQAFLTANNLQEGQRLQLEVDTGSGVQKVNFVIVGLFDYFPTMYPQRGEAFVGNLDYLFDQVEGGMRHSLWLRTGASTDTAAIHRRIEEMGIEVTDAADARTLIIQDQEQVERIGLFGVLSIGFLSGTILSGAGLLVYTYASLQGRLGQLSVLRAIGSQVGDIVKMVTVEYAGVILYGVVVGIAIGLVSSYMFVPFFQFSSDPITALPPFVLQIAWGKTLAIAVIFGSSLILCQLVILRQISRREFFQMLRVGQNL